MAVLSALLVTTLVGGYSLGALGALLLGGRPAGRFLTALGAGVGALAALILGVGALAAAETMPFAWSASYADGFLSLMLTLDRLGGVFLVVIGLVGLAVAIYGYSYTAAYTGRYSLRLLGVLINVLPLSLTLQVMADNAFTFLLLWEIMSLSAYWLVLTESDQPGTVRSGIWYIAMTHLGFAALVAMFLLLAGNDLNASFAAMRAHAAAETALVRNVIFWLALVGFGSKAGIIPLHVWLPMAHPVAPSHVSALMSGVVIKMGIYGLVRVLFDLMGGGPTWWGGVVLGVGATSALLGVLYALMEHDLKRLLAYHSVENIGIILIGIGAGLVFQSYGMFTLAALGVVGGLYHTINHASFKGLLFLAAGSVLHAAHTRNMEEMGGLIKRMPWTAAFFLIGAAAISALPPLNGFVSEWLVFQALLGGFSLPVPEAAATMPLAVGALALTSGLAAACFVKAFGISFLAIPRSHEAEHAHEVALSMRVGMGVLAVACVGLGLAPFIVVPWLAQSVAGMAGLPTTPPTFTAGALIQTPLNFGSMSTTWLAVLLLALLGLTPLLMRWLRVEWRLRVGDTWGCGRIGQTPRMEYTATAFAEPLRRVFAELYRPTKELTIDFHPESKYFVQSIEYKSEITPVFERGLYEPLLGMVRALAFQVRRLQAGSLHLYLVYVVIVLLVLLIATRWF